MASEDRQPLDVFAMLAEQRPEVLEGMAQVEGQVGQLGEALLDGGDER